MSSLLNDMGSSFEQRFFWAPLSEQQHGLQEGFWGPGADREDANPGAWGAQTGQNFTINHLPAPVDFAAIHVWPDNWERCGVATFVLLFCFLG